MSKNKKSEKTADCKKFEMDLTDYVLGDRTFLTKAGEKKLLVHLGKCLRCQEDFWSWRKIWAVMVGKHQSERPEFKAKIAALMEQLKSTAKPAPMDDYQEVRQAAAKVYNLVLEADGEMPVSLIRQKTGFTDYPFYEAVGHLITTKKVRTNRSQCQSGYSSLQPR